MRHSVIAVATVLSVLSATAHAQRVTGVIRDGTSSTLAGAVVAMVDSSGATRTRTLSDGAGRFSIALPRNAEHLHVMRIGFRPRDVPIPRTSENVSLIVVMERIPSLLATMAVSEKEACPGSADRGAAFQMWEQVRSGLVASVVARQTKPAYTQALTFERTLPANDDVVGRQSTTMRSGTATRVFAARSAPAVFALHGYAADDPTGGRVYDAPDADVLLDASFAATHCVRLAAPSGQHPGQVGLAFSPVRAPARDTLIDVAGTIWVDPNIPALASLEFRYTNIEPAAQRAEAGGHIGFRAMPNGVAFIDNWVVRAPIMARLADRSQTDRPSPRRQDRRDDRVTGIIETGGQVLNAHWEDGEIWQAPKTDIVGTVVQAGTRSPIAHAVVTLRGTRDSTTTDAHGRFTLSPVVPGRYALVATDTTLAGYADDRTESSTIQVPAGRVVSARFELPAITTLIARACKGQRARRHTSVLIGRVLRPDGAAEQDGEVRAAWQADYAASRTDRYGKMTTGSVRIDDAAQTSSLDEHGRFVICGVALERPIHLRLVRGDQTVDTTITVFDTLFKAVDWRPR